MARTVADGAFALAVGATIVWYVVLSNGYGFAADDWRLAQRGGTFGDYFQPYNDHLSIVPIAVYKLLYRAFGLGSYLPLSLVGVCCGAAIAVALYLVVRSRLGPLPALVAGASMLWYPSFLLIPAGFNHYVALTAVVLCAWLLTIEDPRADIPLGLALVFALCSSGVGVAGGVGCLAYIALSRPPRRRCLAVAVPMAAWVAWWLLEAGKRHGGTGRTFSMTVHFVVDAVNASFKGLAANNDTLGMALAALFVLNLVWRLRKGPRAARHELAWSAALVFWWIALSLSRGVFATADVFRYQFVGSAFVVLAFLPDRRPPLVQREAEGPAAVGVGLAFALLLIYANHGTIHQHARDLESSHRRIRQLLIVANLGPAVVPDGLGMHVGGFVPLKAGVYRSLTAEYGVPAGTRPAHPDAALIDLGHIRPVGSPARPRSRCLPLGSSLDLAPTSRTLLRAGDREVLVQIRRFEHSWVTVGRIPPGATAAIDLPALNATKPWMIRAPGACRPWDETTSIAVPTGGATLEGTTPLGASTSGHGHVTTVEFYLTGQNLPDRLIGTAAKSYGWVYRWDTTSVPNGTYTLTSVASDSAGATATSDGVRIIVHN